MLALEGRRVSSITIQKILNDNGLGARHERWLALETANAGKALKRRRPALGLLQHSDSENDAAGCSLMA